MDSLFTPLKFWTLHWSIPVHRSSAHYPMWVPCSPHLGSENPHQMTSMYKCPTHYAQAWFPYLGYPLYPSWTSALQVRPFSCSNALLSLLTLWFPCYLPCRIPPYLIQTSHPIQSCSSCSLPWAACIPYMDIPLPHLGFWHPILGCPFAYFKNVCIFPAFMLWHYHVMDSMSKLKIFSKKKLKYD